MSAASKVFRYLACTVLLLVAVLGGVFAAGNALADLPMPAAIAGIVAWIAVAGGLAWLAWRRVDLAVPALIVVLLAAAALRVVDSRLDLFDRDSNGPVTTVILLSLLVPLAVLGLQRAVVAGVLLLVPAAATAVSMLIRTTGEGQATPGGALLGGSTGVLILPMVVTGALFLVAGLMEREPAGSWQPSDRALHQSKGR